MTDLIQKLTVFLETDLCLIVEVVDMKSLGQLGLAAEVFFRYICSALRGHNRNSSSELSTRLERAGIVMGS